MTTRVPSTMTSVDAFMALYNNAFSVPLGSRWNAAQVFAKYCPDGHCDWVRGTPIKVHFSKFPDLDTDQYDEAYGAGAAQKAFDAYQKTMSKPENIELDCKPCTYFSSFWKQKTPEPQRKDLEDMFERCERLEQTEKKVEEKLQKPSVQNRFFNACKVRYTFIDMWDRVVGRSLKTPEEALKEFKLFGNSGLKFQHDNIKNLQVCKYNSYFPFFHWCNTQKDEISLETAEKFVKHHMPK